MHGYLVASTSELRVCAGMRSGSRWLLTFPATQCAPRSREVGNGIARRMKGWPINWSALNTRLVVMKKIRDSVPPSNRIPRLTRLWNPRSRKARDPSTSSGQALGHPLFFLWQRFKDKSRYTRAVDVGHPPPGIRFAAALLKYELFTGLFG
jgi:hypothetical protein